MGIGTGPISGIIWLMKTRFILVSQEDRILFGYVVCFHIRLSLSDKHWAMCNTLELS
jgi:hypothetical protein